MKLGFIGTGNMASAIMGGVIDKGLFKADEIIGADPFAPGRERASPGERRTVPTLSFMRM